MKKYIAKKDTWFKEGTEVKFEEYLYTSSDGIKCGLFRGIRICENAKSENRTLGIEYEDGEICSYDEFDIIDDKKT